MRRPLLLAAALSIAAVAVLVVLALTAPSPELTAAQRTERLAAGLRCPDCQALSVAKSRTRAADAIRAEIAEQVAAGRSDEEIRRHFVGRYGEWILLAPDDPVAWWLPVGVVLAGIAVFVAWLVTGSRRLSVTAPPGPRPSEAERRRIDEELEALDG
ncbi:MAG TPA: cytochrome c-type biogenesis protein CcmH [Candidatus Limnocylindria bacterium]